MSPGPVVAFQGEHGAFSEEALLAHFQGRAVPLPCRSFADAGSAVRSGEAEFALLPVENTLAGSVQGSHDVLVDGGLTIVGEVILPIRHMLVGVPGSREEEIRCVFSHPVALAQCTGYLGRRREVEAQASYDTAGAAREVAERGDPTLGAIAPRGAAARYGLEILAEDLQDRDDNQTRFYLLRREEPGPTEGSAPMAGAVRTVLLLELRDQPGALVKVLEPLARKGIDLSRIESRPTGDPWSYRFLLELRVDAVATEAREALEEIRAATTVLRVLGRFAAAPSMGPDR